MRMLLPLLLLALVAQANAQDQVDQAKAATKIEVFQAKTGIVLVRGYSTVRTLSSSGGSVVVDAREYRDAANAGSRVTGVSFTVKETLRLERENTSFVDADEIDSLIRGIDYVAKATREVTKLDSFEAEYRTKGDFRIIVFNNSSGELRAAVSSGRIGKTQVFLRLADLEELRQAIIQARTKL